MLSAKKFRKFKIKRLNEFMKTKKDYHASLVIYGLPEMKSVTYRRLVDWLEAKVKEFKRTKDTKIFNKNYRSRLMK